MDMLRRRNRKITHINAISIGLILMIVSVNLCEPIKNIYAFFYTGLLLIIIGSTRLIRSSFNKYEIVFFFSSFAMMALPILAGGLNDKSFTQVLKYEAYIAVTIVLCFMDITNVNVPKILGCVGCIHIIATYLFLLLPSNVYRSFAMSVYNYYPKGTLDGLKGYTAGINSHYSANGLYIVVAVLSLLAMYNSKLKARNIIMLLLSTVALLLTEKRGEFLFGLIATVLYYYQLNHKRLRKFAKNILRICLAILLIAVVGYLFVPNIRIIFLRIGELFTGEDRGSGRLALWSIALDKFLQAPFTGVGWLNFVNYGIIRNTHYNVHNTYLQVLCETGIFGFIVMLCFVFSNYSQICRIVRDSISDVPNNLKANILFSYLFQMFFILDCLAENCLYDNTLFFYAIAVGSSFSSARALSKLSKKNSSKNNCSTCLNMN